MKKLFIFLGLVCILTGCTTSAPYSGNGLNVNLIEKDYDILGEVRLNGTRYSIMFFGYFGGAKYVDLLDVAKQRYRADDVINISIDIKKTYFLFFYNSKTYVMRGIAIKYKPTGGTK